MFTQVRSAAKLVLVWRQNHGILFRLTTPYLGWDKVNMHFVVEGYFYLNNWIVIRLIKIICILMG
jgi:hypothetical protein